MIRVTRELKAQELDQVIDRIQAGRAQIQIECNKDGALKSIRVFDGHESVKISSPYTMNIAYDEPEQVKRYELIFNPERQAGKCMIALGKPLNYKMREGMDVKDVVKAAIKLEEDLAPNDTDKWNGHSFEVKLLRGVYTSQGFIVQNDDGETVDISRVDVTDPEAKDDDTEMSF